LAFLDKRRYRWCMAALLGMNSFDTRFLVQSLPDQTFPVSIRDDGGDPVLEQPVFPKGPDRCTA
jgi:hypothetical protein